MPIRSAYNPSTIMSNRTGRVQSTYTCPNSCPGSYSSENRYGFGASIGAAFDAIAEANRNKKNAINNAIATNNHWALPNGAHMIAGQKVVKGNGYIRYEYGNGHGRVVTADGSSDHIMGNM